jgi:TrmH family RNA methyltransferase
VPLVPFDEAPGQRVALVARGGTPLDELELDGPTVFVLGAEREGLPEEIVAQSNHLATIPLPGAAESLNVAAAGVIALYERNRR